MAFQAFQLKHKHNHNPFSQSILNNDKTEYHDHKAPALATIMDEISAKIALGKQCILEKGFKKFGNHGETAGGKKQGSSTAVRL